MNATAITHADFAQALNDAREIDRWVENDIDAGDNALTVHRPALQRIIGALELAAVGAVGQLEPREPGYEGWADVELMGHRTRIDYIREIELAHRGFLELTWSEGDNSYCEIYATSALFSLTPLADEAAADELRTARETQPW